MTISTLTTKDIQLIYESAVHDEATKSDESGFVLDCVLDDAGGTGAVIRKLIDMVRARDVELLAVREAQSVPVQWGSPKTVRQLIQQLQTLDQDLETTALLRMPADFRDGSAIRQVPLSISYERLNSQWLAPYKSDGRLVLAFWAKADDRPEDERGELLTAPPAPAVPDEKPFSTPRILAAISDWSNDDWLAVFETFQSVKDKISTALSEQVSNDTRRMDWLVAHYVEVRKPLLYGSEKFFTAQTMTDEEDDYHATSLREQIDAEMLKQ